jgi:hypothetical protein
VLQVILNWFSDVSSGDPIIDWFARAGPVGILAVVVVMFLRGDIVPRRTLEEAQRQRDLALSLVYDQARLANRAVDVSQARIELEEKLAALREKEK